LSIEAEIEAEQRALDLSIEADRKQRGFETGLGIEVAVKVGRIRLCLEVVDQVGQGDLDASNTLVFLGNLEVEHLAEYIEFEGVVERITVKVVAAKVFAVRIKVEVEV
jgi:hypothetical protein